MASQGTTADQAHNYHAPGPWPQPSPKDSPAVATSTKSPTTASTVHPASPWSIPLPNSSASFPEPVHSPGLGQVDFWPFLIPHQASLYQAQLLHYSNLVSPGRGGGFQQQQQQSYPFSSSAAVATSSHSQPSSRPRASSKVSNKEHHNTATIKGIEKGHGNKVTNTKEKGDRAVIAGKENSPSKMSPQKQFPTRQGSHHNHHHHQGEAPHALPSRPRGGRKPASQPHSSSVPSTPPQRARNLTYGSREPSPTNHNNHSPRSAYSETNSALPSLRPLTASGCQFETAQGNFRRRMPYNIGTGMVERVDPDKIKAKLSEEDERKLTTDLRELYDRLLPTPRVEENRRKLVAKLEKIFNDEWPGNDIRVHLFGSSGNLLCSDDSDAKVPIVKMWDPELGLACDMNVNNTLALENTRMVRTYVELDPRVRPLAMIIKYWTRKRILNDAAFGSTLSSYTWICLTIAFLQLRDPPVIPALHQIKDKRLPNKEGTESLFADDVEKLKECGGQNTCSLGELLFQFFRYYAHEFNYDKYVLSVRLGRILPRAEKKWMHNLCIEEPFNTGRNLGNTADEYSFRGLHLELRRAFDLISEAKLAECCEQYVFPKEEPPPPFIRPPNAPRPVMIRSSSQQQSGRGGRGSNRGRHSNNNYRNGGSNRRASSSVAYDTNSMHLPPVALTPQELAWYAQQQPSSTQFPYSLMSAAMMAQSQQQQQQQQQQEGAIGLQLYSQSQVFQQIQAQMMAQHQQRMQAGTPSQQQQQQQPPPPQVQPQKQPQQGPSGRSRTNSLENATPLGTPLAGPEWYGMYPFAYPFFPASGYTYPSSPATTTPTPAPEFRRSLQRSTVSAESGTSASGSSLRSQSQPASRSVPVSHHGQPFSGSAPSTNGAVGPRHVNGVSIPSFMPEDADYDAGPAQPSSGSPASDDGAYVGYYIPETASPGKRAQIAPNGIAFGDLTQTGSGQRRRLSTDQLPQALLDRRIRRASRSPSPLGHSRAVSASNSSSKPASPSPFPGSSSPRTAARPLVVNGTGSSTPRTSSIPRPAPQPSGLSEEASIPVCDGSLHPEGHVVQPTRPGPMEDQTAGTMDYAAAQPTLPIIVNGSTTNIPPAAAQVPSMPVVAPPQAMEEASFRDRIAMMNMDPYLANQGLFQSDWVYPGQSHVTRQRVLSRQSQNGVIAPLDLAIRDNRVAGHFSGTESQHLSPINEARSPSPTAVRSGGGDSSTQGDKLAGSHSPMVDTQTKRRAPEHHPLGEGSDSAAKDHGPFQAQHAQPSSQQRYGKAGGGNTRSVQQSQPGHMPPPPQTPTQGPGSRSKANGSRENGHVRGTKSESYNAEGGWQKATKGRRKGGDGRNPAASFLPSEQPPRHEADRKGG
ncbi:hypothetical protein ACRALDRAFT_2028526 [Sodiomyces alcalophilus JCM 7366]|uniref:uncharacterized protein n=1 Tax=Sodiomyces alcalophilus JCM 7366 TaxID=591952 RepID=UPI0039B6B225